MKVKYPGVLVFFVFLAAAFTAVSCGQDPIFFVISKETAPKEPLIKGSPTNMVIFEREYPNPNDPENPVKVPALYVASGRLHWYARAEQGTGASAWNLGEYSIPQPGGNVLSIAVCDDYLYAVCVSGHGVDMVLKRIGKTGDTWEEITIEGNYKRLQSIHSDPAADRLFAGAMENSTERESFAILYVDETTTVLKPLVTGTSMLSGVVYRETDDMYYLSTRGSGIYQVPASSETATQLADNSELEEGSKNINRTFIGMIKLKDAAQTIIAVERTDGYLYEINAGAFVRIKYTGGDAADNWMATGKYATGALSLWGNGADSLLVVGIQGTLYNSTTASYTHGYVEFEIDASTGALKKDAARHDPGSLVSATDNDRYTATLGTHPINYLLQTPQTIDPDMTFFASTQAAGLWSYRNLVDSGGWQWNAEQ